jgi:23S rRNA (adenine2503-C2)-methyltransferase
MTNANKILPPQTQDDLKDLSREQLTDWLVRHQEKPYRATQIFKWIYQQQADSFAMMTNLSKALRRKLTHRFCIDRLRPICTDTSRDGSRKYLFELRDGNCIESVLIPERGHSTLCISSQVGCAQGCRFCLTGKSGFTRNLTHGEMLAQVRDVICDNRATEPLTNIVFMGMGEPLANYGNLLTCIQVLTDTAYGFGLASRRLTVSTAGMAGRLNDLGRDTAVNLAISLNATDDATRDALMPINKVFPLHDLLAACQRYPLRPHRRITFEYILIEGVNDTKANARQLARLLKPIKAKINLIPFNDYPGSPFKRPDASVIHAFQQILIDHHYTAIIRHSKGQDILAACGQLKGSWPPD